MSQSFLKNLKRSFEWKWEYKNVLNQKQVFAWKNIYNYWWDIKMFEYDSIEELRNDLNDWDWKFEKIDDLNAKKIDNRQILEPSWFFEYNWKHYLLWLLYSDENKNDTDENIWVLNWVIVNPIAYYKGVEETKEITNETSNQTKKVLLYLKNSKTKDSYK